LGGWNEFLSVVGNGLAMGTLGDAPFVLGTNSTARMALFGASNVISFSGGGVYNGANFLDASSRERKQDIEPLAEKAAMEVLAGLEPVTFAYRDAPGDPRVGFIAEDVPELVARPGRTTLSALDIVAVLTKVVQEQQRVMEQQQKEHQQAIAELTARIRALEPRP
jgi:Chaperone of endosialidase